MKHPGAGPDVYILDVLADDIENFESIMRRLNHDDAGWMVEWGRAFDPAEVAAALQRLVDTAHVHVLRFDEERRELVEYSAGERLLVSDDGIWFELTQHGRQRHEQWKQMRSHDE